MCVWPFLLLVLHKFGRLGRVGWVQKSCHDERELLELYRLRHVRVESCFHALGVDVAEYVRREGDDGVAAVAVFLFPSSDFFASLIAVFVWHMQVTLHEPLARDEMVNDV